MYKINKDILRTPVEEGNILLLEPEEGLYFEMNKTAVLIYHAIEGGLDIDEIVEKMVSQYDVEKSVALTDLNLHIEHLLSEKIILKV